MPRRPRARRKPTIRPTAHQRGYDREWRRIRQEVLDECGYICAECKDLGDKSMPVDHAEPFDGPDDPKRLDKSNLRALCVTCHGRKTVQDTRDGRTRTTKTTFRHTGETG